MNIIAFVVFLAVLALFAIRSPGLRNPVRRPALVATAFAVIGLLTLGPVWPVQQLDDLLGDQNYIDLIQALAATAGFWYLRDAIFIFASRSKRGAPLLLVVSLAAQTLTFALIPDHRGHPLTYIHAHLGLPMVWVHIMIYLVTIGWLSATAAWALIPAHTRTRVLFLFGFLFITAAIVAEVADVTTVFHAGHITPTSQTLLLVFNSLFYPGMAAICIGYAPRTVAGLRASASFRWLSLRLWLVARRDRGSRMPGPRRDPMAEVDTYNRYVDVQDRVVAGYIEPTDRDRALLARVEGRLRRQER